MADTDRSPIGFDRQQWARIARDYSDWWDDRLDRPLVAVTLDGYAPDRSPPRLPVQGFTSFYGLATPADQVVDTWEWTLAGQRYAGDAFPSVWPNFGAGVIAAFLGCRLENSPETGTVWFHARERREAADLHFAFDAGNPWYRRVDGIMRAAHARFGGRVQIGMTDLGGNLDMLSSFRPGEQLLLDLVDCPHEVERLTWEAHEAWWAYFQALAAAVPENPGHTAWTPIFSRDPYYMLQCDFCYMIGPEMFDHFVKPELAASCRRLKHAFYHLDGPGQLPHLDSLLEIPELFGVQWVPGSGQPDITRWPEVYRKIHRAGKKIQLFGQSSPMGLDALDVIADQVGTSKGIIMIDRADRSEEDAVNRFLERHGVAVTLP